MNNFKSTSLTVVLGLTILSQIVTECNSQIPMSMMKKQSKVKSTDDFIYSMIHKRPPTGVSLKPSESRLFEQGTQTGFNDQAVTLMANQIATPDVCEPRLSSVKIPPDNDPRVMYWPTCTKLEQCGGCCGADLLECAPTTTETVTVQVMKQRMRDDGMYDYLGNVPIDLQRHTACECRCKTKPEDCNPSTQYYDEASCMCRCRNADQATSCLLPKRWDESRCRCVCPTVPPCLDDEMFDFNTCTCVRGTATSGGAVPLQASNPCAGQTCRAGTKPVNIGGVCQCRRSRRYTGA